MELLNGDNQYQCDCCQKKTDAYKGIKLQQLPPILTVSLNRFRCVTESVGARGVLLRADSCALPLTPGSYDWTNDRRVKETAKYTFPTRLDMRPYCMEDGSIEGVLKGAGEPQSHLLDLSLSLLMYRI